MRSALIAGLVAITLSFFTSPLLSGQLSTVAEDAMSAKTLFVGRELASLSTSESLAELSATRSLAHGPPGGAIRRVLVRRD